jgi:hypothetical protein
MSKITRQPVLPPKESGNEAQMVGAADTIGELYSYEGRQITQQHKQGFFKDIHKHFYIDGHEHDYTHIIPHQNGSGSWIVKVSKPGAVGQLDVSFEEVTPKTDKSFPTTFRRTGEEIKGGVVARGPRPALVSSTELFKELQQQGVKPIPPKEGNISSRTPLGKKDTQRAKMGLAAHHKREGIDVITLVHGDKVKRFSTVPTSQHYIGKHLTQLGIQTKDHEATIRALSGVYDEGQKKQKGDIKFQAREDALISKLVHSETPGMSMRDIIKARREVKEPAKVNYEPIKTVFENANEWIKFKLQQRGINI